MKRHLASVFLILALADPLWAQAKRSTLGSEIRTKTLANGMKVIVWPDHDIPNVALNNWFRVGSRNEVPGITGLSHFFEHMMFNGAAKYGPGEFDRVMEAAGGRNNAFTNENVTVYQDWFPRTAMPLIFDLEGDRMGALAIDPKMVDSEREVVYSERRSAVDEDNQWFLAEQVQAAAFVAHPYQIPVIGWPSDIESWKLEDLNRYFKTYYAPNNTTLVLAGDVTPDEVFALAEKHIGPIPAQPEPDPIRTREPEQMGERRIIVERAGQVPFLQFAYQTPEEKHADTEALDLLLAILTAGDSSRLHRLLVEEHQIATSVGAYRPAGFDPFLSWFFLTLTTSADPARAESLFDEAIARVAAEGVTEDELRKVKNIAVADFWRGIQTISGKAQQIGFYETFRGDYRLLFSAPDRVEAVTRQKVREVAEKYLTRKNRTVGVLRPLAETPVSQESE